MAAPADNFLWRFYHRLLSDNINPSKLPIQPTICRINIFLIDLNDIKMDFLNIFWILF